MVGDAERDDGTLLDAWRAGDAGAGRALFERHFDAIFRFFRSKVEDVAEDLTQQTFEAIVAGRDRFRGDSSFRTYLFSVARKKLYSHLRTRTRAQGRLVDAAEVSSAAISGPSPSTVAAAREEHRVLLAALRRLPVEMQVAIELFYWEGMGVVEIAEVLEIPVGTVKSRLQRARARLERIVGEIAATEALRRSTLGGFERWARELRDAVGREAPLKADAGADDGAEA
ncbi:MAG: RNA polymerase sigma factor [Deltaproteobacteria bacterium]|nr:MAG: RNA polymerase sigma factor [Deltaproteobacteria bacterium]